MPKNLVIVESPAKARTIENYLGKDYHVASSYGHVRDLLKGNKAIDKENGFIPTYDVLPDKKSIIKELLKLSKQSDRVYLASDDDREGEAISWHLKEALSLDEEKTKRIVFREITKNAIQNAIQNPRQIDINLVNAQQARRVLDRLVGFELSPILWKKIKTGLSAGRVQSVAVRLIVDREREIEKFEPQTFYKISASFDVGDKNILNAELPKRLGSEKEVTTFLTACIDSTFSIKELQKKPLKKSPAPPFTTSTLQQEASRKMGFSVSQTMTLAQKLYEAGFISYMRTDSVNLSDEAIQGAVNQIKSSIGEEYVKVRKYKTKSNNAQEAHEAIRPTNFALRSPSNTDAGEKRLYDLIWKRAIASQMSDADIEKTTATISVSKSEDSLIATGEVVLFDGFLSVYLEASDDDEKQDKAGMLPPLKVGQQLEPILIESKQRFTRHPPRYSEASLVKKLEEMGIGRPSTYAPTITTIQKRNYVEKENREGKETPYQVMTIKNRKIIKTSKTEIVGTEKNKLFPTNIAMVVTDFLVEHFPDVTNYSFTAQVEKKFDEVASGTKQWGKMIEEFYKEFHFKVELTEAIDRSNVTGSSRNLGNHPKTGKPIITRLGKFGPIVQMGVDSEDEKPQYASLTKGQFIENITLEDALKLFELPKDLGEYQGHNMIVAIGRFGPYIKYNNFFVSIPKPLDPYTVERDQAITLVDKKIEDEKNKYIKTFDQNSDIQVLNGRYGPYIKAGKKNVKIPKDKKPEELTLEECLELAKNAPEKKRRSFAKKK